MRFWTPDHEKDFQTYMAFDPGVRTWRNAFTTKYGESPRGPDDGGDYDYRKAWLNNEGPHPYDHDTIPHWGSAGKKPGHPTEWMNRFLQQFNLDPNEVTEEQVTPEMQDFMKREINGYAEGGRVGLDQMMALLGERMEDSRGNTYESIGPDQPSDFNAEDYSGRFPTYDYPDGKMDIDLGGKRYFRTLPPGTLKRYPDKHMPLEWMRRIEGFPTS